MFDAAVHALKLNRSTGFCNIRAFRIHGMKKSYRLIAPVLVAYNDRAFANVRESKLVKPGGNNSKDEDYQFDDNHYRKMSHETEVQ